MANPDLPQGHSRGQGGNSNASNAGFTGQSRLEKVLTKGSLWKKQTLRDVENKRLLAASESNDCDTKTARLLARLSAQLDKRNDEIERLRGTISKLENEKSQLGLAHRRELELNRAELECLQDAYDQFERESDCMLSELGEQNERLLNECRHQNGRSLLKP